MNNQTPMHFVLQLGAVISLYLSVSFLLVLIFGLVNLVFPDTSEGYYALESATSGIKLGLAMVLVFAPTYFFLTRRVNKIRRQSPSNTYLTLTKWLLYLSLLVGVGALLIDFVTVIMSFLDGELTTRFILKAAAVLLVIGAASYYYLLDAKGYWLKNEMKSVVYGIIAAIFAVIIVGYGFTKIETPEVAREVKIDNRIVVDLQDMQWRIEEFERANEQLPQSIADIYGTFPVPVAPEGRTAYMYEVSGDMSYKLCGDFAQNSYVGSDPVARPVFEKNYDWNYQAGEFCFNRVIDSRYKQ